MVSQVILQQRKKLTAKCLLPCFVRQSEVAHLVQWSFTEKFDHVHTRYNWFFLQDVLGYWFQVRVSNDWLFRIFSCLALLCCIIASCLIFVGGEYVMVHSCIRLSDWNVAQMVELVRTNAAWAALPNEGVSTMIYSSTLVSKYLSQLFLLEPVIIQIPTW